MPFVNGELVVEQVDAEKWKLRADVVYQGMDKTFTVPAGFITDFATVPRAAAWLIPRYGTYTRAAILHDYFCVSGHVSRADADGLFRRCLHELGVSVPRRWIMWCGVRAASRMRDATIGDWFAFLLIGIPALVFIAVPFLTVSFFGIIFWGVELLFWSSSKATNRTESPPPGSHVKM